MSRAQRPFWSSVAAAPRLPLRRTSLRSSRRRSLLALGQGGTAALYLAPSRFAGRNRARPCADRSSCRTHPVGTRLRAPCTAARFHLGPSVSARRIRARSRADRCLAAGRARTAAALGALARPPDGPAEQRARALWLAEDAARELPNLTLEDALQLVHLYAELGSPNYERAALRWLERYLTEGMPAPSHIRRPRMD